MHGSGETYFVVTGGPGSGQSWLIDALQASGYARSYEAGRSIIQDQVAIGGRALPWVDPALFAEMMLCWELCSYQTAQRQTGLVFFDRGVPDLLGYLRLLDLPIAEHNTESGQHFPLRPTRVHSSTDRMQSSMFQLEPWQEIYRPDRERKQGFEEAVTTYEAVLATYTALG